MCARGILLADVSRDFVRTQLCPLTDDTWRTVLGVLREMSRQGDEWLASERVPPARRRFYLHIDGRYRGQTHDIRVRLEAAPDESKARFVAAFHAAHRAQHGHDNPAHPIEIVNCRVQAVGLVPKQTAPASPAQPLDTGAHPPVSEERRVYFGPGEGWIGTPVYRRDGMVPGMALSGPAIIEEMSSTTVVLPGQTASIDPAGNIRIQA
jgi:N-methylhydantoinase A